LTLGSQTGVPQTHWMLRRYIVSIMNVWFDFYKHDIQEKQKNA